MSDILPDMSLRSWYQLAVRSLSPRMTSTILAPWRGGLEYIGLAKVFNLPLTVAVSSGLLVRTQRFPALSP